MSNDQTFQIEFQPTGRRVTIPAGDKLLAGARGAGVDLAAACGGDGSCGQCQVIILEGQVSAPTPAETFILTEPEQQSGRRLACCTQVQSDLKVAIPPDSIITGQRLQIESDLPEIAVDPVVCAVHVNLQPPTLSDTGFDMTRLVDAIQQQDNLENLKVGPQVIRSGPGILRENHWRITAFVRGGELVGLGPYGTRPLGLAVDLGTTKIAAYLVDLETGQNLASAARANPQIGYGEDVISRLSYAHRDPAGGQMLADIVRATLNEILGELVKQACAKREQVVEACIVGNTAMSHLLLNLPTQQLAAAPYVPAVSDSIEVRAAELGLEMAGGACVHLPPCIGGFIGADHVAMILATDMDRTERVTLGVDIGTNTEISIRKPGSVFLTSVSCASGPALEGAHIGDGMRAAAGAIEKVRITRDGIELVTIDQAPPVGLCGSGIIDTAAELYKWGLINQRGRFQRHHRRIREGSNGPAFWLVPAGQSASQRDIIIDQSDVNQIQLAKGAIHAGLQILLKITDTAPEEVEQVIIAGAFGSFLNIENALAIGLFPGLPNAHYRQVGNAALIGAKWLLISSSARQRARQIQEHTKQSELSTYPQFNRIFALGMLFPDRD